MTPPLLFADPAAEPVLQFKIQPVPGGGLLLVAVNALGGAELLLSGAEGGVAGKTARELFPDDPILVDEWVDFLVKQQACPGGHWCTERSGPVAERHTLQFVQAAKDWVFTRLTANIDTGEVAVYFLPPQGDRLSMSTAHVMGLQQALWLESFIEGGGDWEMDLANETIFMSRQMARMMRFGDDAMVVPLQRFMATVHPDDLPAVQAALANVGQEHSAIYSRTILEDGELLYFKSFGIPGYDAAGAMTCIVGRSMNTTATERANHQLAASEQRFRGIVESSQDLFVVADTAGSITYLSPNVVALTGRTQEQVLGTPFTDYFVDADEAAQVQRQFMQIVRTRASDGGEYRISTAAGGVVWLSVRISAIPGEDGRVAEMVAVCRDVTEDKKQNARMLFMSEHDALTGAYNRFHFEKELKRIDDEGITGVGLVMTDLNGLKLVNDAFGHQQGDALLREMAALLDSLTSKNQMVARVGGDEFAVFLYDSTPANTEALCERIDAACRKTDRRGIPLSISWGVAFRADTGTPMQALYEQAEGAMYANKVLDSRSMRSQVLNSLKETLRLRNVETADHTQRMTNMVMALGRRLGLPGAEYDKLVLLAAMHDIGKVAIPDHIINKPGRLTDEEWEIMRSHSEVGYRIAMTSQELSVIANEIGSHHEWWNGKGYPEGLSGEDIPLLSRIISVVDAYDVMTHRRVYKEAVGHNLAIEELQHCADAQFDPLIVEMFLDIFGSMNQSQMRNFFLQQAESGDGE